MGRERRSWSPSKAFWLPNGSNAQGRPDITALLNAREPHEQRVSEHLGTADKVREQGTARKEVAEKKDGNSSLKALLGDDVPSGMLGSQFSRFAKMSAGGKVDETEGPSGRPSRPTSRGAYRYKDGIIALKQAELHSTTQHFSETAGFGGTTSVASPTRAGISTPFSPTRAFVRVGVPVSDALEPHAGQPDMRSDRPGTSQSAFAPRAGSTSRGSTMRPVHPSHTSGGGYPLSVHTSMVSIGNATADLPKAAVMAVRKMIGEGHNVTVAAIHQRRPPYIDMGPPLDMTVPTQTQPFDFGKSLRMNDVQSHSRLLAPFRLGAPQPWHVGSQKDLETFDYTAKLDGVKYYVSDFTQPSRAMLRPATSQSTRYANFPSMLLRPEAQPKLEVPLLDTKFAGEDATIRMRHADQGVLLKRPTTSGGRLVPYANDSQRQAATTVFFP